MLVEWDVPIAMDDDVVLRANVFRPDDDAPHPVVLGYGPYGKDLAFQEGYPDAWAAMVGESSRGGGGLVKPLPGVGGVRSGEVGAGRICVRAGRRPRLGPLTRLHRSVEHRARCIDLRDCIEWAGTQPWSNGKVGLLGISYYAVNQWQVAALSPPHLAAMIPWEGFSDFYRELSYHGGIAQRHEVGLVPPHRHDGAARARASVASSAPTPASSSRDRRRTPMPTWNPTERIFPPRSTRIPLDDDFHRERSALFDKITVPFLSAGNWGGVVAAPARQCGGVRPVGLEAEVAGDPRPRTLDGVLHRLRNQFTETVFRPLPQGRRQRLGPPTPGHAAGAHRRRRLHRPHRKRMAHRAHPVDELVSRPGRRDAVPRCADRRAPGLLRRPGRVPASR